MSDDYGPFWTYLPTHIQCFLYYAYYLSPIFAETPTYHKIGRPLWTFPFPNLCYAMFSGGKWCISGSIVALLRHAESQYLIFNGFYTLRSGFDYFIAGKKKRRVRKTSSHSGFPLCNACNVHLQFPATLQPSHIAPNPPQNKIFENGPFGEIESYSLIS